MREQWRESYEQRRQWRARFRRAEAEHAKMAEEVLRAQLAGKDWPDGWSAEKIKRYQDGPKKHADALQAKADAKANERNDRDAERTREQIARWTEELAKTTDPRRAAQIREALRDYRAELYLSGKPNWQDHEARSLGRPF